MVEYIEREKLIKSIQSVKMVDVVTNCNEPKIKQALYKQGQAIRNIIEKQPTADVVEVKHGEWRQNPYCKRIYFCSECGRHIEDGSNNPLEHFPYCHCGAKMDKRSD